MGYIGGVDYERSARIVYGCLVAGMIPLVAYLAFRPGQPQPANDKAFGCYIANQAAPISLDKRGMTILQAVPLRMGFHLERNKNGIALTADAPIAAAPAGPTYLFSIEPRGVGRYLDFVHEIDGTAYGVFNENALQQFKMLADDGAYLRYRKASPKDCPE